MASHSCGRTPLSSLNRDIAILTASGFEWSARIRRLAARVPAIDIFGSGYVLRGAEGWEITAAGRDFLAMLEAITQDNLPPQPQGEGSPPPEPNERAELIVVGHRFRNRVHRPGASARKHHANSRPAHGLRGENALK